MILEQVFQKAHRKKDPGAIFVFPHPATIEFVVYNLLSFGLEQ